MDPTLCAILSICYSSCSTEDNLENLSSARAMNTKACQHSDGSKDEVAEALHLRALSIVEESFGVKHPEVATILSDMADCHMRNARYEKAEPLFKRALAIRDKALDLTDPRLELSVRKLALVYEAQGRYAEAEPLRERALAMKRSGGRVVRWWE